MLRWVKEIKEEWSCFVEMETTCFYQQGPKTTDC
jgi:hypothetical protein